MLPTEAICKDDEIRCDDEQRCVELESICDGVADCRDRTDEFNCTSKQHGGIVPWFWYWYGVSVSYVKTFAPLQNVRCKVLKGGVTDAICGCDDSIDFRIVKIRVCSRDITCDTFHSHMGIQRLATDVPRVDNNRHL